MVLLPMPDSLFSSSHFSLASRDLYSVLLYSPLIYHSAMIITSSMLDVGFYARDSLNCPTLRPC